MRECVDRTLRRARRGRRAGHLGAVQPRRHPARHPVRPGPTPRSASTTTSTAPRSTWSSAPAGPAPPRCSRCRCPAPTYVYQGEELGLWENENIPVGPDAGPDVGPPRPQPRRLPGAAAVDRRRAAVRLHHRPTPVAAPAGRVEGPHGPGADRRPELDAGALPRGDRAAPAEPGLHQPRWPGCDLGAGRARVHPRRRFACVLNMSGARRRAAGAPDLPARQQPARR